MCTTKNNSLSAAAMRERRILELMQKLEFSETKLKEAENFIAENGLKNKFLSRYE